MHRQQIAIYGIFRQHVWTRLLYVVLTVSSCVICCLTDDTENCSLSLPKQKLVGQIKTKCQPVNLSNTWTPPSFFSDRTSVDGLNFLSSGEMLISNSPFSDFDTLAACQRRVKQFSFFSVPGLSCVKVLNWANVSSRT